MRNAEKPLQSVRRPTPLRPNPNRRFFVFVLFFYHRYYFPRQCRCVAWDPGPLDQYRRRLIPSRRCGKSPINKYVSNPLRAVGRGVCVSAPCLRPCPAGSLLTVSQCPRFLDGGVRCSIVAATPLSFEMRRWADTEPADPDLLFEVRGPRRAHKPARPLGGFMLLHNALEEMLLTRRKRSCRALHEYLSGWLLVFIPALGPSWNPRTTCFGEVSLDIWYNDSIIPTIFERCLLQRFAAYSGDRKSVV